MKRLALPLGLAVAALVLGAAVAGAGILHGHYQVDRCHPRGAALCIEGSQPCRPSWVDPAAFGIVVVGAALAYSVLVTARRTKS
jgi:hypothetical protein